MKYEPDDYTGSIEIIDGSPFPFVATVQRRRKSDLQPEPVPAIEFLSDISDWLIARKLRLLHVEGSYIYYTKAATL